MAALRVALLCVALVMAAPSHASPIDRWAQPIAEASARFGIPDAWIRRVMAQESGGETLLAGRPIVSSAGAMGLMQLMPGTWRDMRLTHGLGADPYDPHDNIIAGAAYLRAMYDRFGYPGLFAAYNAGPARYANHLATGRALPAETVAYVAHVAEDAPAGIQARARVPALRPPPPTLFAVLAAGETPPPAAVDSAPAPQASSSLFARLSASAR